MLRSIRSGLAYLRKLPAVTAGFVMDLSAMTFGMPRALFPVLALTVYHAGAAGTGLLYAAVAAGSTIAALTTGWMSHARRLGRIALVAVAFWGIFIAARRPGRQHLARGRCSSPWRAPPTRSAPSAAAR